MLREKLGRMEYFVELQRKSLTIKGVCVSVVVFGCNFTLLTRIKGPLAQIHVCTATSHIPSAFMSTIRDSGLFFFFLLSLGMSLDEEDQNPSLVCRP